MTIRRATPLSGIAFVVFFIASIAASSVPKSTAPDQAWVAAYATHSKQAGHLATGILLVLAGLCLLSFVTQLWRSVAARAAEPSSPLPLAAAGVAAACLAVGGILMAAASATALLYSEPLPGAAVLRFANDAGFGMAGVAGMLAAAFSVATLSVQARAVGIFSTRMHRFSLSVAVVLIASILFIPIVALLAWTVAATVVLARSAPGRAIGGAAVSVPSL